MGTIQTIIMTSQTTAPEDHRSSAEIQADIRQTRGRMDATLDEIGNRLTARSLLNSALDWWDSPRDGNQGSAAARSAVKAAARQVRHHPMPSLLIGSGIAWLISESMDHDDDRRLTGGYDPDPARARFGPDATETKGPGMMDKAKEGAAGAVDTAKDKLSDMSEGLHHQADHMNEWAHGTYDRSRSAAQKLKRDLKDGYHRSAVKIEDAVEEYPLAVGVAFAALGALAGLAIPRTRREDELLGDRSDHLFDAAKEKGSELLESGKAVGARVVETIKEEAAEQGLTGDAIGEKLAQLADKSGEVVKKAKEEAVHAAEDEGIKPQAPKSSVGGAGPPPGFP